MRYVAYTGGVQTGVQRFPRSAKAGKELCAQRGTVCEQFLTGLP